VREKIKKKKEQKYEKKKIGRKNINVGCDLSVSSTVMRQETVYFRER